MQKMREISERLDAYQPQVQTHAPQAYYQDLKFDVDGVGAMWEKPVQREQATRSLPPDGVGFPSPPTPLSQGVCQDYQRTCRYGLKLLPLI